MVALSSYVTKRGLEFLARINDFCGYRAEWKEKYMEDTSEQYGYIPTDRPLQVYLSHGVVNLDKPPGPTSHEVVAWVKRMLGVSKAGHGGTLGLRAARPGAGRPQGNWRAAHWAGEDDEGNRHRSSLEEGLRVRDAAARQRLP